MQIYDLYISKTIEMTEIIFNSFIFSICVPGQSAKWNDRFRNQE